MEGVGVCGYDFLKKLSQYWWNQTVLPAWSLVWLAAGGARFLQAGATRCLRPPGEYAPGGYQVGSSTSASACLLCNISRSILPFQSSEGILDWFFGG